MKIRNKKEIKKNEIRKNKKTEHPAYIYARVGNSYKFIGITHSPITQGVKNIKLDKNPNPKDTSTAYIRPKGQIDKSSNFKSKEKDWKLSKQDKRKVQGVISKDKKK